MVFVTNKVNDNGRILLIKRILIIMVFILFSLKSYAGGGVGGLAVDFNKKLFIHTAIGGSSLDIDSNLAANNTFIPGALDKSGRSFEVGLGYKHSDKIFSTLTFQRNQLDIADIDNIYGSVNYQFSPNNFNIFVGGLAGYSRLKWSEPPSTVNFNQDLKSGSFMYGLQFGVEKEINQKVSILLKYQFIKHDHRMEILNNTSDIEHRSENNILLGLRYNF